MRPGERLQEGQIVYSVEPDLRAREIGARTVLKATVLQEHSLGAKSWYAYLRFWPSLAEEPSVTGPSVLRSTYETHNFANVTSMVFTPDEIIQMTAEKLGMPLVIGDSTEIDATLSDPETGPILVDYLAGKTARKFGNRLLEICSPSRASEIISIFEKPEEKPEIISILCEKFRDFPPKYSNDKFYQGRPDPELVLKLDDLKPDDDKYLIFPTFPDRAKNREFENNSPFPADRKGYGNPDSTGLVDESGSIADHDLDSGWGPGGPGYGRLVDNDFLG